MIAAVGTRPDIIKMVPLVLELRWRGVEVFVLDVGQHNSENMSGSFFAHYGIKPDAVLVDRNNACVQAEFFAAACREALHYVQADSVVLVYGDTLAALALAVVGSSMGAHVVHVEAGLRSFDTTMPEEMARMVMDNCASLLFAPTQHAVANLLAEGHTQALYYTGNLIANALSICTAMKPHAVFDTQPICMPYAVLTLHRPENVDDRSKLSGILHMLDNLVPKLGIHRIFIPVHPRIDAYMQMARFDHICGLDPLPYQSFIPLLAAAMLVFTDSGGVQEECAILHKKCVTLRRCTERPETVEAGWNMLLCTDSSPYTEWEARITQHIARPARDVDYGTNVAGSMADILLSYYPN